MTSGQTVRAVVLNDAGEILMIERRKPGEHYFALPGGHVESGESSREAVVREVAEETGLTVVVQKLLYTSEDVYGNDQRIFLCDYTGGEPKLGAESVEARAMAAGAPERWSPAWFTFEALRGETVYPVGLLGYLEDDKASGYHRNPYELVERRV